MTVWRTHSRAAYGRALGGDPDDVDAAASVLAAAA